MLSRCRLVSGDAISLHKSKLILNANLDEHFDSAALARSRKGYVSLEIAKILCERGLLEKNGLFYWRHDRRLLAPSPLRMTEAQILSCLENIHTKTCLIWASDGFAFDSKLMQARIKAVRNLTKVQ